MFKKNKNYVFASLFITIIVLVPLFLTFHQKSHNESEYNSNANNFKTCGPYTGYLSVSDREKIDIYTNTDSEYVTSVTTKIVSNFLNQNYEQEQPTYKVAADFYCGINGDLKWVYAASRPAFHSSIVNLYTSSCENNERTESYYFDITSGGVVTGAVFVSEKIGFIGLSVPTELGFEIYATLDSGISWSLVEIEPPSEWSNSYSMIPVVNGFNIDEGIYPFVIDKKSDKKIIYLTTDDSGNTWCWKE